MGARSFADTGRSWGEVLASTGDRYALELTSLSQASRVTALMTPKSLRLCVGLAELALGCARAMGVDERSHVGLPSAMLALLTKVDDQVIDSPTFHGGWDTPPEALYARTRARLAPTLASIRTGEAATEEGRCLLAAALGRHLHRLGAPPERLRRLLEVVEQGWEIQARAVRDLTRHPGGGEVTDEAIDQVTEGISGAWLLMVTMVGTLGSGGRLLTATEERAFFHFGLHIQRVDALADLEKDVAEGLSSTCVARRLWRHEPELISRVFQGGDASLLYRAAAEHDIDLALLPPVGELSRLESDLASLGQVPSLLRWIHAMLLSRYVAHRACTRRSTDPRLSSYLDLARGWDAVYQDPIDERRSSCLAR